MSKSSEGPTRQSSEKENTSVRQATWFLDEEMLKKSPSEIWDHWKDIPKRKPQDYIYAVEVGQYLGISDEEIKKMVKEVVDDALQHSDHSFAHEVMKRMDIGTEEERRSMAALAYEDHVQAKSSQGAAFYAKEAWGEQSPQYLAAIGPAQKQAKKREKEYQKEQEKSPALLPLPRGATFADFYKSWHKMVAKVGSGIDIELEAEMKSIIGEVATKEIMNFLNGENDSVKDGDVLEFFKKHGSNEEQIGEVLGIDFKERKPRQRK